MLLLLSFLRRILWVWLVGVFGSALAQDYVTQRAWLEDAAGTLKWEDVHDLQPPPYIGILSKGFGRSVIWVRLRIDPSVQSEL